MAACARNLAAYVITTRDSENRRVKYRHSKFLCRTFPKFKMAQFVEQLSRSTMPVKNILSRRESTQRDRVRCVRVCPYTLLLPLLLLLLPADSEIIKILPTQIVGLVCFLRDCRPDLFPRTSCAYNEPVVVSTDDCDTVRIPCRRVIALPCKPGDAQQQAPNSFHYK